MKTTCLCWLLCIGFSSGIFAQVDSLGNQLSVPKLVQYIPSDDGIEYSLAYQKAHKIYDRLVKARGDYRFPAPYFKMTKESRRAASIDYDLHEIVLEKKAFDVCNSFGAAADAAIAYLLAHELTHYYEKHAWRRDFFSNYKDLPNGIHLDSLIAIAHETEADYLGGFLAFSAGFGLFDKGPEVIERLYKKYDQDIIMPGYPSMVDRQTLSIHTTEQLQPLVEVFEMANILTAVGSYGEANEYYQYVLARYQSREIYNNLGVLTVMEAMTYFSEGALKYRYPIEFDLESPAKSPAMTSGRYEFQVLRKALPHFDAAINMDPYYVPAYLNKACTYALLGDDRRARFYAEEARTKAQHREFPKSAADLEILLGILEANAGDSTAADNIFAKVALKDSSALAAVNLAIHRTGKSPKPHSNIKTKKAKAEKIDGQRLTEKSAEKIEVDYSKSIALNQYLNFHQKPKHRKNSKVFVSESIMGLTYFLIIGPGYDKKTAKGISLGANHKTITDSKNGYGEPRQTIETPRGQILVYSRIIFILGPDGKLERWMTYLKT